MIKVLDFWANWCPPCQVMNPIIEEVEKELEGKVIFEKIDVDANSALAQKYNVMSIPTYVVLTDNQEAERIIGVTSKEKFLNLINKYLTP